MIYLLVWEERNYIEQKNNSMNSTESESNVITNKTEKKFLKKEWCGIYKIINRKTDKYYVGSSNDIPRRWKQHLRALKRKSHYNRYLQRSWNKHEQDDFYFIVLEEVSKETLLSTEQKYLDTAKTERKKCYNVSFVATGGCDELILKAIKSYWTDEKREERSVKMKGKNNPFYRKSHTKEIQNACGKRFRGTKLSDVHKSKISQFGKYNAATDNRIYIFNNNITGENFKGMRIEFKILHPELSSKVDHWVRSGCISLTGWSVSLAQ